MTFKSFDKLALGDPFALGDEAWIKVPCFDCDGFAYNAIGAATPPAKPGQEARIRVRFVYDETLVNTAVVVDMRRVARIKDLFASAKL